MTPPKLSPAFGSVLGLMLGLGAANSVLADYPSLVLQDSPALYYRLNDNAALVQYPAAINLGSLGASANGVYNHGPGGVDMKQQPGALSGSSDASVRAYNPSGDIGALPTAYVDIPYSAALNPSGPFTVEFWVKPTAVVATDATGNSPVFGTDSTAGRSGWLFYMPTSGKWNFRVGNTSGYVANISGGTATPNVWQHVAGVYDGTSVTLYVDGVAVAGPTPAPAYSPNMSAPVRIGATTFPNRQFDGWVDEVAIFGSALPASTIAAHFSAATTNGANYQSQILTAAPLGYWRLNEPLNPVAVNAGTLGAAAKGAYMPPAVNGVSVTSPTFGGFEAANTGVDLDGVASMVRIPAVGTLTSAGWSNVTEATFICWVKRDGAQVNYKGLLGKRPLSDGLYLNGDDTLNYSWNDAGNTWSFNSGLIPPDGEWALAAVTVQPDKATFYMQSVSGGFSSAVNTVAHNPADFTTGPFAVGNDVNFGGTDRYFKGSIDEAALFTKALPEGRIRTYFLEAVGTATGPQLVTDPPVVSPAGTIYATTTFTVTVDAYGYPALSYQWSKDGNPLPGATSSTYTKANATTGDSGAYTVYVSNGAGNITSQPAIISVNAAAPPTIVQGPVSMTRYLGGRATFTVTTSGTEPMKYQWKHGTSNIPDATNATFSIFPIAAVDAGQYSVAVTNVAGYAVSAPATLTLKTPVADSYEAMVIGLGPLAYWRLNEANGATAAIDYMGGYDATHVGAVASGVAGPRPPTFPGLEASNTGTEYNGADTGSTTGVSLMNNRAQFSILGWFKMTGPQPAANGRVGLFGQNDVAEFGFHGLGTVGIWTPGGGFASFNSSLVQQGNWYFITATGDGTNLTLYLNGQQVAQVTQRTSNYGSSTAPFNFGYAVLDASGNYFLGDMDEIAFFDRALSLPEIFAINSKATGIELKITMTPGHELISDSKPAGARYDGYNNGAVWLASSTDSTSITRQGVMQFNPTNGPTQVIIPWQEAFDTSSGTMTFWVRSGGNTDTNGNEAAMLIDRRTDVGDVIVQQDAGTLFWQPNWIYGQSSFQIVNDDRWHHVAYVFNQFNTVQMYIDGLQDAWHTDPNPWTWPANQIELGLSHDAYWRAFDGLLDDFRIYDKELTSTEVAQIAAGDNASPVAPGNMLGRYNFDAPPGGLMLTLTWPIGTLQSAPAINGPWTNVGVTSPYIIISPTGPLFYRLKL